MKIEEQVLSREQMAHLEALGVDTSDASMCWLRYDADEEVRHFVAVNDEMCYEMACAEPCPTYTIGDLIEKLSLLREKRYGMEIIKVEDGSCSVQHPFWGIRYDKTVILSLYHTFCEITEHNNRKSQGTIK